MARYISHVNLISLYLPAFILSASNGVVVPALPVLAHSLSASFMLATLALAAQMLGSSLAAIPTGYLLDNLGRRKVTISGLVLVAISGLLMTTATSFPQLIFYQLLAGCGSQMWMLGRLTLIGVQAKTEDRGRQVTGMMAMENFGMLLGPAIGGGITMAVGPTATFGFRGVLCLAAALMVFLTTRVPKTEQNQLKVHKDRPLALSLLQILKTPPLPKIIAIQLLVSLARGSIFSGTLDLYMVYAYGTGPATIGLLRSLISIVGLPITFSAGHIMDRFGRKATIIPGFALITVGLLAMAIVAGINLPFPYFVGCLLMVNMALSLTSGSMQTLGIDLAPPEWSGRFLGFLRLSTEFGHFLSPMGFAFVATGLGYPAAFVCLALTGASVSLVVARWLPNSLHHRGK
jgi:MFS family permease